MKRVASTPGVADQAGVWGLRRIRGIPVAASRCPPPSAVMGIERGKSRRSSTGQPTQPLVAFQARRAQGGSWGSLCTRMYERRSRVVAREEEIDEGSPRQQIPVPCCQPNKHLPRVGCRAWHFGDGDRVAKTPSLSFVLPNRAGPLNIKHWLRGKTFGRIDSRHINLRSSVLLLTDAPSRPSGPSRRGLFKPPTPAFVMATGGEAEGEVASMTSKQAVI